MKKVGFGFLFVLCLGLLLLPALFMGEQVEAATVQDYGFTINGEAITSAHTSGNGYSYDPSANTLTLSEAFATNTSVTYKSQNKYRVRGDYKSTGYLTAGYENYIPTIDLKDKDSITILIDGTVLIGKRGEGSKYAADTSDTKAIAKSYGIYGYSCDVTIRSAEGGRGKLNIETTDTAIFCRELKIEGVDVNLDTHNTSAIYARNRASIGGASNVTVDTDNLGSLYMTWNLDQKRNVSKGIYRFDSIAAIFVSEIGGSNNSLTVKDGSTLTVNACVSRVIESDLDLRDESEGERYWYPLMNEKMQVLENGEWVEYSTHDTRLYSGIWTNDCDFNVYGDSTVNVNMEASNKVMSLFNGLRTDIHGKAMRYLYRTIGVNTLEANLRNCHVNVNMYTASKDICVFGHDTHAFYCMGYDAHVSDKRVGAYTKDPCRVILCESAVVQARIDQRYSTDPAEHQKLAKDNKMWCALDWENDNKFHIFNDNLLAGCYMVTAEYDKLYGDLCLYRSVRTLNEHTSIYLRQENGKYQYSRYYDFRTVTDLASNVIDVAALGWEEKNIEVRSGNFSIKPAKSGLVLSVTDDASVDLLLEGGKNAPYTGKFDLKIAGCVTIDGDGYLKDLGADGLHLDRYEGYWEHNNITSGKLYLKGGTAETGTVGEVNCSLLGGNYRFSNEKISFFVDYNGAMNFSQCSKYAIKLGDYEDLFDCKNLVLSNSHLATGIYPIDGVLYFWHDPDGPTVINANPISFHHFTYRDDRGYDSYVFPKKGEDGNYTVYRLEEREVIRREGASDYYAVAGEKNFTIRSFYFVKVYDMPGVNPFHTDDLTETDIPGTLNRTQLNGAEIIWRCYDAYGKNIDLNADGKAGLQLVIDTVDYEKFSQYHDYYCWLWANGQWERYNFDLHVLFFSDPQDQYAGDGETAQFRFYYEADGDWLTGEGFTWHWEMREGTSGEFTPISDSKAESYAYRAFYNSPTDNAHGYQFRRVASRMVIGGNPIVLCSAPATLYMGAKIVQQPPKVISLYENDPRESITFTLQYVRGTSAKMVRWNGGTTYQPFEGATFSTVTDANGVTTLTVTLSKADFQKSSGKWDNSLTGAYSIVVEGGVSEDDPSLVWNDARTENISIQITLAPYFSEYPENTVALEGGEVVFTVGCQRLLRDDLHNAMWWEYSLDNGLTWRKVTSENTADPLYIKPINGVSISLNGVPAPVPYRWNELHIGAVGAEMDGAIIRAAMKDEFETYYSDAGKTPVTLRVISFPAIDQQPQSQTVNVTEKTSAELTYTLAAALPEGVQVTYQWQKRLTADGAWVDLATGTAYECSAGKLIIRDLPNQAALTYYRCLITATQDGVGTASKSTAVATVQVLHDPHFTTAAPTPDKTTDLWEQDSLRLDIAWDISLPHTAVKWQICRDGTTWQDYTPVDGEIKAQSAWIRFSRLEKEMRGWQFRCVVTNTIGDASNTKVSDAFTIPRVFTNVCEEEADFVKVSDKGYTTLQLTKDITLSRTWVVDRDLTLDLNGHILQGDGGAYHLIKVTNGATLTIIDSDPTRESTGGIRGGSIRNGVGAPEYEGATTTFGGALYLENGKALLLGGTICQCTATLGSAVYVAADSCFVLDGGQITCCASAIYVGGTKTQKGRFELKSGSISNCDLAVNATDASVHILGGRISGCGQWSDAPWVGGAVYMNGGEFFFSDGVIENCFSGNRGAALALFDTTAVVTGGRITGCYLTMPFSGGAIYQSGGSLTISGLTIENCRAENGGAIYIERAPLSISQTTFSSCTANANGGAIYASNLSFLTIGEKLVIKDCSAGSKGGAMYLHLCGDIKLSDTVIQNATAQNGVCAIYTTGAIYADGGYVEGSVIAQGGILKTDLTDPTTTSFYGSASNNGASGAIKAGLYYGAVSGIPTDGTVVTVTFYHDGAVYATLVLEKNCKPMPAARPEDPRTFIGWFEGDLMYLFDTALAKDLVLVAKWAMGTDTVDTLLKDLEDLEKELDKKADTATVNVTLEELRAKILALEEAKTNYVTDATLQEKLNTAIEAAKDAAVKAAEDLVKAAEKDLQEAIDQKANAATVNQALDELNKAVKALENAKEDYAAADTALEEKLTEAIKTAKEAAIKAAEDLVTAAEKDLQEAIKKGDASLGTQIAALEVALQTAKQTQGETNEELTGKIAAAQATLQKALETLEKELQEAEAALQDAIGQKADAATLTSEIKRVDEAITALQQAMAALEKGDGSNLAELELTIKQVESSVSEASATLQEAIEVLSHRVNAAEEDIAALRKEMQEEQAALQTALIAVAVVFGTVDVAALGLGGAWYFKRKKHL